MQTEQRAVDSSRLSDVEADHLQRCVGTDGTSRRRKGKGITPHGGSAGESMTHVMK